MAEQEINKEVSDEERFRQMAAQMRAAEYKGLSEEEIQEKERQKEVHKIRNIQILDDTLNILEKGSFEKAGQEIKLQFSQEQMQEIQVFLPEDIEVLRAKAAGSCDTEIISKSNPLTVPMSDIDTSPVLEHAKYTGHQQQKISCSFGCENEDALVLAQRKYLELKRDGEEDSGVLVLNLASATHPGGQTRKGASAQEEDLCRRTSLLLSLESENAKKYYDYNNARKTHMGSDSVMISPCVEVIKDASTDTLSDPFPISVMSCAAPMIRMGLEGMTQQEYRDMLSKRIQGMLLVAASLNYRSLILGAFGCGIFGNDAAVVSDLFYKTIQDFSYVGKSSARLFDSIDFAVWCRPDKDYNYREFCRNFSGIDDSVLQ